MLKQMQKDFDLSCDHTLKLDRNIILDLKYYCRLTNLCPMFKQKDQKPFKAKFSMDEYADLYSWLADFKLDPLTKLKKI